MNILRSVDTGVRFDAQSLVGTIKPTDTVEEIVSRIEERSGKKFKYKIIHSDVVQMVGNIFNFFEYSHNDLSKEIVMASKYAKNMKI